MLHYPETNTMPRSRLYCNRSTHTRTRRAFLLAHANICACLSPFVSTCVCLVYYLYKDLGQGCANQTFDSVVNEKSVIVVSLDSSLRACVE